MKVEKPNPGAIFVWFLTVLVVLFIGWIVTGGPERETSHGGFFIAPPAPLGTGEPYGDVRIEKSGVYIDTGPSTKTSLISKILTASRGSTGPISTPEKEYLTLKQTAKSGTVKISGIKLSNGKATATIPNGSSLPIVGNINEESPIILSPSEYATVSTGRSPLGISFRVNKCSGYLNQFQDFIPKIDTRCPLPEDDAKKSGLSIEENCISYLKTIPRCTMPTQIEFAPFMPNEQCAEYTAKNVNYNACVERNKDDADFYSNEWRIFLGKDALLWQNGLPISVIGLDGKTIDTLF